MAQDKMMTQTLTSLLEAGETIQHPIYGSLMQGKHFWYGYFCLTDTHLLIEGSEIFFKYMRENAADRDSLKAVIADKIGINLPIGPYKPKAQGSAPVADKGLEEFLDLAHKGGIPIEYV